MTTEPSQITAALFDARNTDRRIAVPEIALTAQAGYQIQEQVFTARGAAVAAWKIGLTHTTIQEVMGSETPAAGRLASSDLVKTQAIMALLPGEYYAEAELVFEIGHDLPFGEPPIMESDVAALIGGLYVGIELVCSRFSSTDLPLGLLIADNCMAERLAIGDRIADRWEERFTNVPVEMHRSGHAPVLGSTAAVMGSPLAAVTWLVNWLAARGKRLHRGQFVSSGTCTGATLVAPGDRVTAVFPGMGSATMEFAPLSRKRRAR